MVSIIDLEVFDKVTPEQGEVITGGTTVLVAGVDFSGGDIQSIPNSNLSSCRQAVDDNPAAILGIYNIENQNCFLKSTNVTPNLTNASIGIIDVP